MSAAEGLASTLYADIRALAREIEIAPYSDASPRHALLFDPQTAGALLARQSALSNASSA